MAGWQRLLVAQVLPFAAVLQGLEVLHASAVTIGQSAVALVGRSGSGKTSVALALCRSGAGFLADDVLVLERLNGELVGHPGAPVAGVDRAEVKRMHERGIQESREVLSTNPREEVTRVSLVGGPAPLRAVFFLDRSTGGPSAPRFEPAPDAQALLSATFNLVLASPHRLEGLLDICAQVARRRVERIVFGGDTDATQLSRAIEHRIGVSG